MGRYMMMNERTRAWLIWAGARRHIFHSLFLRKPYPSYPVKIPFQFASNSKSTQDYPLVICYIAIEHCHRNSGFIHNKNGGSFQFAMLVITRGYFGSCQVSKPHWSGFHLPPRWRRVLGVTLVKGHWLIRSWWPFWSNRSQSDSRSIPSGKLT